MNDQKPKWEGTKIFGWWVCPKCHSMVREQNKKCSNPKCQAPLDWGSHEDSGDQK